jgi:hypothetical protein
LVFVSNLETPGIDTLRPANGKVPGSTRHDDANLAGTGARELFPPLRVKTFKQELPLSAGVLIALLLLVLAFSGDSFTLNILAATFLFGGVATAWNIIGGLGGQFSLGHSVFFAVGAYTTANLYLTFGVSPWLALVPAALLAGLVAVALSWPVFRLRGPFFAIATMAFTEVLLSLAMYFDTFTGGARGLSIPFRAGLQNMIFRDRFSYALLMLGFLGVALIVFTAVTRSRLGYSLQAIRDNQDAVGGNGDQCCADRDRRDAFPDVCPRRGSTDPLLAVRHWGQGRSDCLDRRDRDDLWSITRRLTNNSPRKHASC